MGNLFLHAGRKDSPYVAISLKRPAKSLWLSEHSQNTQTIILQERLGKFSLNNQNPRSAGGSTLLRLFSSYPTLTTGLACQWCPDAVSQGRRSFPSRG